MTLGPAPKRGMGILPMTPDNIGKMPMPPHTTRAPAAFRPAPCSQLPANFFLTNPVKIQACRAGYFG